MVSTARFIVEVPMEPDHTKQDWDRKAEVIVRELKTVLHNKNVRVWGHESEAWDVVV